MFYKQFLLLVMMIANPNKAPRRIGLDLV